MTATPMIKSSFRKKPLVLVAPNEAAIEIELTHSPQARPPLTIGSYRRDSLWSQRIMQHWQRDLPRGLTTALRIVEVHDLSSVQKVELIMTLIRWRKPQRPTLSSPNLRYEQMSPKIRSRKRKRASRSVFKPKVSTSKLSRINTNRSSKSESLFPMRR